MADQCRKSWVDGGANQNTGFASSCPVSDSAIIINKFTFTRIFMVEFCFNWAAIFSFQCTTKIRIVVEYYNKKVFKILLLCRESVSFMIVAVDWLIIILEFNTSLYLLKDTKRKTQRNFQKGGKVCEGIPPARERWDPDETYG